MAKDKKKKKGPLGTAATIGANVAAGGALGTGLFGAGAVAKNILDRRTLYKAIQGVRGAKGFSDIYMPGEVADKTFNKGMKEIFAKGKAGKYTTKARRLAVRALSRLFKRK